MESNAGTPWNRCMKWLNNFISRCCCCCPVRFIHWLDSFFPRLCSCCSDEEFVRGEPQLRDSIDSKRKFLQSGDDRQREKEPLRKDLTREETRPTSRRVTAGTSSSFEEKIKEMRAIMRRTQCDTKNLKVGIFSRSAESDYEWLKRRLESEFSHIVRPCYISNNGFQQFLEDMCWCDFGILYHTRNRGRINLTDVTDSLYDEELQYLSQKLDMNNVIVVIDDLTDSSDKEKDRILGAQPKLQRLAQDVFLFSTEEKK
ncbi:uncharacterized protein [Dendropsophus ebraccatus]|uniref:uncharacterized protein n=1 Tax=Dendropsophus ebraccatus TaxID=150705 RepID=UPI0038315002